MASMFDVPYSDPMRDQLEALEQSVEDLIEPGSIYYPMPGQSIDDLGHQLGGVEDSIEGTTVPPLAEGPALAPEQPIDWSMPLGQGPTSPGPPRSSEPAGRPWPNLLPPTAAKPFYTDHGPSTPSYRPHVGGSKGIGRASSSRATRWCPELEGWVSEEETCNECDRWADHGAGYEQCHYDWQDENQNGRAEDGRRD